MSKMTTLGFIGKDEKDCPKQRFFAMILPYIQRASNSIEKRGVKHMKFYGYNKCSTCRKAQKFLDGKKVKYQSIDITETPPPKTVLKKALKTRELKKLFNTSGVQYKELNIKDKLKGMTEAQALDLLASNGRLVKRPIAVDGDRVTVGFDEAEYKKVWKKPA
jgi:arsenate reductase